MIEKTWKAAIYLRLSKEDGTVGESSSIKNQREIIKDFLAKNSDISIVSERIDDGISGVSFDRPSFNAMIDDVRDRVIDCVIVKDLSRFGRDHLDAGDYIENIFPILGVRFIAITDGIDTINKKSSSDNIMIPFKNLINSTYSRDISLKSRSALDIKRKQGQFVGPFVAYGYVKSIENKNKIVADENVADNVREIFRLKLSGMSADKIAEYLNNIGVLSPSEYKKARGTNYTVNFRTGTKPKWHAKAVLRILENPLYIGTLIQGKVGKVNYKVNKRSKRPKEEWVIVEDNHEAIVEKETFETVQNAMRLDTRTAPDKENVYLFSGLLYCAKCGESIKRKTITAKNGKKYVYYCCKTCNATSVKEDFLIDTIFATVKSCIASRVLTADFLENISTADLCKIRAKKLMEQLKYQESETERIYKYKKSLYESHIDGMINKADYDTLYSGYIDSEKEVQERIGKIKDEIEAVTSSTDKGSLWLESFKKHQNISELNRAVVVELIERIFVEGKNKVSVVFRYESEFKKLIVSADKINQLERGAS